MRYILDFGSGNAGLTPTFTDFVDADTWVSITPPTIVEAPAGDGAYYFDFSWTGTTSTSIWYKATVAGVELSDTINSTSVAAATGAGGTGAASVGWLWTAGNIINTVAVEVGLDEASDPYASTDRNFVRLRTLLRSVGHELWLSRDWEALTKEASYTGDGASTLFNLPADFGRMKDGSGWNRTNSQPLDGPLSSQQWQYLQAWTSISDIEVMFRITQNRMQFYAAIPTGEVVYHDYISRYWVASDGAASPDKMQPTASSDLVMLEPLAVMRLLKVKWLEAIGEDSTAARQEFAIAYQGAAANEPAPVLHLGGPRIKGRFINGANVPDTGYGS